MQDNLRRPFRNRHRASQERRQAPGSRKANESSRCSSKTIAKPSEQRLPGNLTASH